MSTQISQNRLGRFFFLIQPRVNMDTIEPKTALTHAPPKKMANRRACALPPYEAKFPKKHEEVF